MADTDPDQFNLEEDSEMNKAAPISFGEKLESLEDHISHAPLDLGGGSVPASAPAKPRQQGPIATPAKRPVIPVTNPIAAAPLVPQGRITGIKIFFTKLHAGALDFLSEQISDWLKANPNIHIKQTSSVVGEIAAKQTDPNLIITVWY